MNNRIIVSGRHILHETCSIPVGTIRIANINGVSVYGDQFDFVVSITKDNKNIILSTFEAEAIIAYLRQEFGYSYAFCLLEEQLMPYYSKNIFNDDAIDGYAEEQIEIDLDDIGEDFDFQF